MERNEAFDLYQGWDDYSDIKATRDIGAEVGIRAWPDELNFHASTVIYRLLEVDGETDYSGPFMIDAEGIVRIAGDISKAKKGSYSFIIEALASDGTSSQSDVQTLFV